MNMFKNNGGFTLVELIVVIAILAILAGVAVPVYSGYIAKAEQASDYSQLDSLKTAAIFSVTEKHPGANVSAIEYDAGNAKVTVTYTCSATCTNASQHAASGASSFVATEGTTALMGGKLPALKSASKATWSNAGWELTPKTK